MVLVYSSWQRKILVAKPEQRSQIFSVGNIHSSYRSCDFSEVPTGYFWRIGSIRIMASWMGDFMPTIIVTLTILFYLSKPFYNQMKWRHNFIEQINHVKKRYIYIDVIVFILLVVLLALVLDFNTGICSGLYLLLCPLDMDLV